MQDHREEKTNEGFNTTAAREKYTNASRNLAAAEALPSARYMETFQIPDLAKKDIAEGERLLDKAWAQKDVADAQERISLADARIAMLKNNASTAGDPNLNAINAKRDVARSYLTTAQEEIRAGNYELAREKAQDSWNRANESYTDSFSVPERNVWERIQIPCLKCGPCRYSCS